MYGPSFHYSHFHASDLEREKVARGLTVSVCLPARDEEATVGEIVTALRTELSALVDEVVVIDDQSVDDTAAVAARAGARVARSSDVLPEFGPSRGKGDALWRSLHLAEGDLLCWLDADLADFEAHFVTGLLGPLLIDAGVGFVKGHYERPAGGRVTELMARPVISTLHPRLAPIVQPLGGEYAGRRSILERVPFPVGWGVEVGILYEVVHRFGARAIAQVDLGVRHHRTRTVEELSPQAMAILITALRKAGVDVTEAEDLLRSRPDGRVERVPVETIERPPMIEVAAYRAQRRAVEDTA